MKKSFLAFLSFLITTCGFSQFKADMELSTHDGKNTFTVYSDNDQYRYEFKQDGQFIVLLIKPELRKTIILLPEQKFYMSASEGNKMNMVSDPLKNYDAMKVSCTEKVVSKETVEGYICEKRELYKNNKKMMTVWYSGKLQFPLKMVDHIEESSMSLKNIQSWIVNPDFFEVPGDYVSMMR